MELFQFANVEPLNQELQPARSPRASPLPKVPAIASTSDWDTARRNAGGSTPTTVTSIFLAVPERRAPTFDGHRSNAAFGSTSFSLYFLGPRFSLEGEGQQWRTVTPAYVSTVSGAKISLTHRWSANTAWSVSMSSEHDISTIAEEVRNDPSLRTSLIALGLDPSTAEQNGTLNLLGFDMHHSRVDNLLDARRGYQLAFHVDQAGDLLPGTFHFRAASIDGRYYQPLSTRRLVLATRVQLGSIDPIGGSTVPLPRRYFLGGSSGVRGWSRYEISP